MQMIRAVLAVVFVLPALGCQDRSASAELQQLRAQASLEQQNKELVLKWYEEVDNGNIEAAVDLFHPEFRWYSPSNSPNPVTKDSVRGFIDMFFAGFPKWTHSIDDLLAVDDKVIARTVDMTKHTGEFQGIPATGNDVEFGVIVIFRVKDGKIVDMWEEADMVGFMNQIGMELQPKQ